MKKLLKNIAILLAIIMICSCATTENIAESNGVERAVEKNGFIIRGLDENPEKLQKNDVMSITSKIDSPEYFEFSNWSKIRITSDILDELHMHEELSNEQKYKLMSYIFDDLPKNGKDGITREIRLGKFFSNGKGDDQNLVIKVGVFTPAKDAQLNNEKVIIFYSNAIKLNNEILRGLGKFLNFDSNATVITAYNNNLLTNGQKANADENNKIDISSLNGFDIVLYAQSILADEDLSNDINAHELCTELINKQDEQPAVRITAMLMEYNYRISLNDIDGAQKMWDQILEYCVNVSGDMTPENLNAINGESLFLLKSLLK